MESDIQRFASKNDMRIYRKGTVANGSHEHLKGHAKFIGSVNITKLDHDLKFDSQKTKCSRKFDENETRMIRSDKIVDGKVYQRISNIPPIVIPKDVIGSNLNDMNKIIDKLIELECLMKNILNKFEKVDSVESAKVVSELDVEKIVKNKIQQILSASSRSLNSSISKLSSHSNITEVNGENNLSVSSNNAENDCDMPRWNKIEDETSDEIKEVGVIEVDHSELNLIEGSNGTNSEVLRKETPCLRSEQFKCKYIDQLLSNVNSNLINCIEDTDNSYYIDSRKVELDSLRDWACKSTSIEDLGIDNIYSLDESHQLLTSNVIGEIAQAQELALGESNYELTNIGIREIEDKNDQELALNEVNSGIRCRSKSMPSIDFSDELVVSMASFSSISKLESLSIESNMSVYTS